MWINNILNGRSEPINAELPFLCHVFPANLFSAFSVANLSVIAGQEFSLSLLGQDRFGNAVNSKDNRILVELSAADNISVMIPSDLKRFADYSGGGVAKADFKITISGQYSAYITIDYAAPQKNPFLIICSPEQKSSVSTSGLQITSVTNTTQLAGQDSTSGTTGVWVCISPNTL